jgi:hypothetical protein
MITPASIGDWTQAIAMASLLAGAGLALSKALRADLELGAETRSGPGWEAWRDQRIEGPLPFEMVWALVAHASARSSMDRALGYGPRGWGFDSLRARHGLARHGR